MADSIRGFISYSTADRVSAAAVKDHLGGLDVLCFMAHDDLHVSDQWRQRIIEELQRMEVFVALLSKSFKASDWAPQELGFAVSRPEVPVIPLMIDTVPFGFVAHLQGKKFTSPLADSLFLEPLERAYPRRVLPMLVKRLCGARSFRHAEGLMDPIRPFYHDFIPIEADAFVDACIENGQIWDAGLCATQYIPEFIAIHRTHLRAGRLEALEYQIRERKVYRAEPANEQGLAGDSPF